MNLVRHGKARRLNHCRAGVVLTLSKLTALPNQTLIQTKKEEKVIT